MMREKNYYSFLRSLVSGQDHSFFKDLTGVFCTGGTLVKKISSKTRRPISIKHGTSHSWVKRIQDCSNKGPGPLQRGDNHRHLKVEWHHLEIFLKTTEPEKLKLT
jgi:hypothetical protein